MKRCRTCRNHTARTEEAFMLRFDEGEYGELIEVPVRGEDD
jgi:hypothetical protein